MKNQFSIKVKNIYVFGHKKKKKGSSLGVFAKEEYAWP